MPSNWMCLSAARAPWGYNFSRTYGSCHVDSNHRKEPRRHVEAPNAEATAHAGRRSDGTRLRPSPSCVPHRLPSSPGMPRMYSVNQMTSWPEASSVEALMARPAKKVHEAIVQALPRRSSHGASVATTSIRSARGGPSTNSSTSSRSRQARRCLRGKNIDEGMTRFYKGQAATLPVECGLMTKPLTALKKVGGFAAVRGGFTPRLGRRPAGGSTRRKPLDHPIQPWLRVKMDFFVTFER